MTGESNIRDADRVYDDLRRRILILNLEPGSVLDESRIVQEMGISRTPVREAVIRLVSDGLLRRDGRQVRVTSFEVNQLRAFFEGMTLLSRAVHRTAALRRSAHQLRVIRDALNAFEKEVAQGDEVRISEANHAFHEAVGEAADSVFIQRAYQVLLVQSLRLARQCFAAGDDHQTTQREHLERTVDDHRELYQAIERRDAEEADRIASRHSLLFRERLSKQILGPATVVASIPLADLSI
jgi:DNA-binding GntR family transcriptional regulator